MSTQYLRRVYRAFDVTMFKGLREHGWHSSNALAYQLCGPGSIPCVLLYVI